MSEAGVRVKETVEHRAPLGLNCVDALDGRTVSGLRGWLRRSGTAARPRPLQPNPGGLLVAHGLPGFARWELAGEPLPPQAFDVRIDDPSCRFFPARFELLAPAPAPALAVPGCLTAGRSVPLFSRPERAAPPGTAQLRAQLLRLPPGVPDEAALAAAPPAAWALVELHQPRPAPAAPLLLGRGLADARGELLLLFRAPEPAAAGGARRSPFDLTWSLALTVRYGGLAPVPAEPGEEALPGYCELLAQPQRDLVLAIDPVAPPPAPPVTAAATLPLTLRFGQPIVATTAGRSVLYVRPA